MEDIDLVTMLDVKHISTCKT